MARVVILGGGFGGLYAARALAREPVEVVLIDRRNHHLFQPLLYQVATATLNPSDIAVPIRGVLRKQKNARVLLGEASRIDPRARQVHLADGAQIPYDFLIVATGATHSYFGHDEWAQVAPGLKSIEDALDIRRRAFLAFEAAERVSDPAIRASFLTFVVIGAGPTGVEMAGALAEIAHLSLPGDFRSVDPKQARVLLVEAMPQVLPSYPPELSARAERRLGKLKVEVRTGTRVTAIDREGVTLVAAAASATLATPATPTTIERLPARTVIWAAGVAASPLARSLGVPLDRAGRVLVRPDLTIPGHDDVFVVGDLAALEQDGKPVPGVSPAAMQGARHAVDNIRRRLESQPMRPFRYFDKGSFAVIGRGAAVGQVLGRKVSGLLAWLLWIFVHLFYLIGFRNRLLVLIDWAYSYLLYRSGARLITGEDRIDRLLATVPTPAKSTVPPVPAGPAGSDPARPSGSRAATPSPPAPARTP